MKQKKKKSEDCKLCTIYIGLGDPGSPFGLLTASACLSAERLATVIKAIEATADAKMALHDMRKKDENTSKSKQNSVSSGNPRREVSVRGPIEKTARANGRAARKTNRMDRKGRK